MEDGKKKDSELNGAGCSNRHRNYKKRNNDKDKYIINTFCSRWCRTIMPFFIRDVRSKIRTTLSQTTDFSGYTQALDTDS
jgi:hypothetical protein